MGTHCARESSHVERRASMSQRCQVSCCGVIGVGCVAALGGRLSQEVFGLRSKSGQPSEEQLRRPLPDDKQRSGTTHLRIQACSRRDATPPFSANHAALPFEYVSHHLAATRRNRLCGSWRLTPAWEKGQTFRRTGWSRGLVGSAVNRGSPFSCGAGKRSNSSKARGRPQRCTLAQIGKKLAPRPGPARATAGAPSPPPPSDGSQSDPA